MRSAERDRSLPVPAFLCYRVGVASFVQPARCAGEEEESIMKKFGIKEVVAIGIGAIVGLLGHALGDALFYGSVWWSWVFPEAVVGILIGVFAKKFAVREGGFTRKNIVLFNVVQVVSNALAWILLAPALDIAVYAEPANKVFLQGAAAFLGNILIVGILGSLLLAAYSRIAGKSASLEKED